MLVGPYFHGLMPCFVLILMLHVDSACFQFNLQWGFKKKLPLLVKRYLSNSTRFSSKTVLGGGYVRLSFSMIAITFTAKIVTFTFGCKSLAIF